MRTILLLSILILLSGCRFSSPEYDAKSIKAGELRIKLFEVCMSMSADINKATSQHYNDLDEVVKQCSAQARYMANQSIHGGL